MDITALKHRLGSNDSKRPMKMSLATGILFGVCMGIFWSFLYGSAYGIIFGIVVGVLFGVLFGALFGALMGAFAGYQKKKFQMERALFPDEELVMEGGANHVRNFEAVGGWIYLTNQRLLFRPHSINVQRHELSIPCHKISDAKSRKTLGIIPNGLEIKTIDGSKEKFVVEGREDWIKKIIETKERCAPPSFDQASPS